MEEKTNHTSLFASLCKAQAMFESATKDGKNPHFGKSYAPLSSIWDACKKGLAENGLFVTQITQVRDNCAPVLLTRVYNEQGECLESETPIICSKQNDAQAFGSAMTYARRYGLASMLGIVTDDDDGEASMQRDNKPQSQKQPHKQQPAPPPTKKEPTMPAPAHEKTTLLLNLEGFAGLYTEDQIAKLKESITALKANNATDFKAKFQEGIQKRCKEGRKEWAHTASEEQLDLIDKLLLSRIFDADEKATFNTAAYEYDKAEASVRIEWLTNMQKERKQSPKPATRAAD